MIRIFEDQASRERYRDYSNSCSNEFDDETLGAPRDRDCLLPSPLPPSMREVLFS
jgi:hypothetical protein